MTSDIKYPLVSILMTAYNRQQYIGEAIESVLESTYNNFELIIVDDSSSDETARVAQSYASVDNRIKLYVNKNNLGDYPNRNKAASYASGVYLMYLDSDDKFFPNAIEYVVSVFSLFKDSQYATIYQYNDLDSPKEYSSEAIIQTHFFKRSILHIGPGGTVITKELFNKIGGFTTLYGPANDMYYNLKVASNSSVILMPFKYLYYRIHEGQEINNKYGYLYHGYNYFNEILKLKELPLRPSQIKYLWLKNKRRFVVNLCKYFIKTRNVKKTIESFRRTNFSFKDFILAIIH